MNTIVADSSKKTQIDVYLSSRVSLLPTAVDEQTSLLTSKN